MKIEITREDYDLLSMLLGKEEVGTRVEIHHCRTHEFKEVLKKREEQVHSLRERIDKAFPAAA
jgi:hypothetical protein